MFLFLFFSFFSLCFLLSSFTPLFISFSVFVFFFLLSSFHPFISFFFSLFFSTCFCLSFLSPPFFIFFCLRMSILLSFLVSLSLCHSISFFFSVPFSPSLCISPISHSLLFCLSISLAYFFISLERGCYDKVFYVWMHYVMFYTIFSHPETVTGFEPLIFRLWVEWLPGNIHLTIIKTENLVFWMNLNSSSSSEPKFKRKSFS